jgi:GNAT superfamily N-acetyltransferase
VSETARIAVVDDLGDLEWLARQAIEQMRSLRGGVLWSLTLGRQEPVRASLEAALVDPDRRVVVGLIDDTVVGYGAVAIQGLADGRPLGVIEELFVAEGARSVGVGEAMMDLLVEWCTARRCVGIDAVALPGDRETKNFFETFGLKARALVVHRALDGEPGPAADAPDPDESDPGLG